MELPGRIEMTRRTELADLIEQALNKPVGTGTHIAIKRDDWLLIIEGLRLGTILPLADAVAEALQNIADYWAYGMAKAEGAVPTEEDHQAAAQISAAARKALNDYQEKRPRRH